MDTVKFAGPTYPAKSGRLELIDLLKEQMSAGYQTQDRASITRPVLDRVVADLEHAVLILDALQEERAKNVHAPEHHAKLVSELMDRSPWREKPDARVALAIAARAIRRGRHLTEAEQMRNLADAMAAEDIDPSEVGDLSPVIDRLRKEADASEQRGL